VGPFVQAAPGVGERQPPGRPLHQPGADPALQLVEGARQRGLADPEHGSGGADRALVTDRGQCPQVPYLDIHTRQA
jgi:hypothetical protein